MINQKLIEGLSEQFNQLLAGQGPLPGSDGLKQQVETILQSTFRRMDLVTRDEFDAQAAVLQRTREKLERMEQQLDQLEQRLAEPEC